MNSPLAEIIVDAILEEVEQWGRMIWFNDERSFQEIRKGLVTLVQQLIDNYLIEAQIADFPGIEVTDDDVTKEFQKSGASEGASSQSLREAVRLRIRMQKYFEMRFGQFIQASDEDVKKYYNVVFVPEAQKRGLNPIPPLADVSDLVRSNIIQESMNHEITIWLEAIRRRSNIEVFE